MKEILTIQQPRYGALVGKDALGNEYYENRDDIHGRDRWVVLRKWNYDASQIPPEWHQWMHRMTDDIPSETTIPKPFYASDPRENLTGTRGAFKTYNTTVPKMTEWEPKALPRR
nr:hypothetical protein HK105_001602 [Polyrhizophydium stewartii]